MCLGFLEHYGYMIIWRMYLIPGKILGAICIFLTSRKFMSLSFVNNKDFMYTSILSIIVI